MTGLVLCLTLAAGPGAGVGIGKRAGLGPEVGQSRAEAVRRALGSDFSSLPIEDFTACAAKRACVLKEAGARGWSAVVLVETATVLTDALVNVTLLAVGDGREVARFTLQASEAKLAEELARVITTTRAELVKLAPPPVSEPVGVQTQGGPKRTDNPPVDAPPQTPVAVVVADGGARPAARWIPAIVGAAVLTAGVVLVSVSASFASRLRNDVFPSPTEPTQLATTGAALQSAGWGMTIGGGLVAAGGLLVALIWPSPRVTPVVLLSRDSALLGVGWVMP